MPAECRANAERLSWVWPRFANPRYLLEFAGFNSQNRIP